MDSLKDTNEGFNPLLKERAKVKKKKNKERLDVLLVERGFFKTREMAKRHIMAGIILVDNVPVDKAGTKVPVNAPIRIKGHVMPYVGRGGYKLEKAIKEFHIDLKDKVMADIGASTGGFTDCALQHHAKKVFAIDVGYNQLDWKLRTDSRVINMEKTNIKNVSLETLGEQVDFISTDISFISVLKIIPAVKSILKKDGSLVILIKPQFEAGREKVGKGGIVHDRKVHEEVIRHVIDVFDENGFEVEDITWSPIKGGSGNIEFLAYIRWKPDGKPLHTISDEEIEAYVNEAHEKLKG